MTASSIHHGAPDPDGGGAVPILRTEGLTVRFGGLTALNNVNVAVRRGEIRAIIGPNGAGKSTFFNCLTGVIRPTAGRIFLDGDDVTGLSPDQISRKALARSYQITNIMPGATVLENVRIAAQSRRHGWSLWRHHLAYADLVARSRAVLAAVGLLEKEAELAANLSHGEQRNLEIGIALATEPRVLCLDEPTAGMSAAETRATVLENVRIAAQSRRHAWSLLRHYRAYADVLTRARGVLSSVGLLEKEDELASNLSHGEQRNLEIGIALATEPKVLCLDEPTAGMSVAETHATVELVRRIAANHTILIVEHDMEVVMGLAQTITVLHYGEVLAEGTPAEIQANPRVQEVYLKT